MNQEAVLAGEVPPAPEIVPSASREPLQSAIDTYLRDVHTVRGNKAHRRASCLLTDFAAVTQKKYLDEITRDTLVQFQAWLKKNGASPKTIRDRLQTIETFRKTLNLSPLLKKGDLPKVIKRMKDCYTEAEVNAMLAVADDDEKFLIQFLLATGVREQEAAHTVWADIQGGSLNVTAKLDCRCAYCEGDGFKIKDCEERPVPLPDWFLPILEEHRNKADRDLLFANSQGTPEGHILAILQGVGLRAGINCGKCVTRSKQSCGKHAVCRKVGTHKFRRTFATWNHILGGVALSTLRLWLGHADIETTMIYICPTEIRPGLNTSRVESTWQGFRPNPETSAKPERRLQVVA